MEKLKPEEEREFIIVTKINEIINWINLHERKLSGILPIVGDEGIVEFAEGEAPE